jgi:UDP-N-acetyl-D-mannosaminuronic acid dehydrogenase
MEQDNKNIVPYLRSLIIEKRSIICIIGLGQVGLPIALSFLKAGFKVVGYDTNEALIRDLSSGRCHLLEQGLDRLTELFIKNGTFRVGTDSGLIDRADVVVICVPTPLDATGSKVDLTYIKKAVEDVTEHLQGTKLIVVESSIPPGTMRDYIIPAIESRAGKRAGKDFLTAYCPERISPGNALKEFTDNPRVIGANDDYSYLIAHSLFKMISSGEIYRTDTTSAELSKLAENTYRDINIAFANELAIICEGLRADVLDVIRLANSHPRVNIHKPGPGVGGPCLPKDPYLLVTGYNIERSLIKTARLINDSMVNHVTDILMSSMNSGGMTERLKIVVLGVAYKPEVNDARYSSTRGIIMALKKKGFEDITVHDPYLQESFGAHFSTDMHSILREADCVIVATAHHMYSLLSYIDFKEGCVVVDAVRILDKKKLTLGRLKYVPLGGSILAEQANK